MNKKTLWEKRLKTISKDSFFNTYKIMGIWSKMYPRKVNLDYKELKQMYLRLFSNLERDLKGKVKAKTKYSILSQYIKDSEIYFISDILKLDDVKKYIMLKNI